MPKYRIKSKQRRKLLNAEHEDYDQTYYYVQYKLFDFLWITITTSFTTLKQAEEHITLKLKERDLNETTNKTI